MSRSRRGIKQYLRDSLTRRMMRELDEFFIFLRVEVPAMRHGASQAIETMLSEEVLLLAKYLQNETKKWSRWIAMLS